MFIGIAMYATPLLKSSYQISILINYLGVTTYDNNV